MMIQNKHKIEKMMMKIKTKIKKIKIIIILMILLITIVVLEVMEIKMKKMILQIRQVIIKRKKIILNCLVLWSRI